MRKIIAIIFIAALLLGCKTVSAPKRAINDSGMVYAMVYDYENSPVSGAAISIDGKKYIESDLQGRFILEFKQKGEHTIKVEKPNYEVIEEIFTYDPMNVLYFKMINSSQLLTQAEESLDQNAYKDAEAFVGRALALEPNRQDILYLQCVILYFQNRKAEAKIILEGLQNRGINGEHIEGLLKRLSE